MSNSILRSLPLFFIVTCALAQDDNPGKKKMAEIDFLVGQWNVSSEIRLSAQGPWESSEGVSRITRTVGSTVLEEDFSGSREGRPFSTKSLLAVNNQTLRYQRVFVDSEHGSLIDFDGQKRADSLVFDRTWIYPSGASVQLRVVYKFISRDTVIVESMRKPEKEPSWDVTGRMRYARAH